MVIKPANKHGAKRHRDKPETVKCGPSASSSPSPLWSLARRWRVRLRPVCRGSAPSAYNGPPVESARIPWSSQRAKQLEAEPVKVSRKVIMYLRICAAAFVATFALNQTSPGPGLAPDPCRDASVRPARGISCVNARPTCSAAGRIRKRCAAACTTTPPLSSRTMISARRCCAASARPVCRPSRTSGCRRRKQSEIGPTFTKIAKPTLQCMFEPAK